MPIEFSEQKANIWKVGVSKNDKAKLLAQFSRHRAYLEES